MHKRSMRGTLARVPRMLHRAIDTREALALAFTKRPKPILHSVNIKPRRGDLAGTRVLS